MKKLSYKNLLIIFLLSTLLVIGVVIGTAIAVGNKTNSIKTDAKICGGIAGIQCDPGYKCNYEPPMYPDKTGTCILIHPIK